MRNDDIKNKIPNWVKWFFRFYGVLISIITIIVGLKLISLSDFIDKSMVGLGSLFWFVLVWATFTFALNLFYVIGLFRFKQWVLPIVFYSTGGAVIAGMISLLRSPFESFQQFLMSLTIVLFSMVACFATIKYWRFFKTPMRRLFFQIPMFIMLTPTIFISITAQVTTDDEYINDEDLIPPVVGVIARSENAYYTLPVVEELLPQKQQQYYKALSYAKSATTSIFDTEVIRSLEKVDDLIAAYINASDKSFYQCPTLVNNFDLDARLCELSSVRDMAKIALLKAKMEAGGGDLEQSIKIIMSVLRMSDLLINSKQPIFIEYLVSISIMRTGLETLENIVDMSISSSTDIAFADVKQDLERYLFDGSALVGSLRREYMSIKEANLLMKPASSYFYYPNKTVNGVAEFVRMQISVATAKCGSDYAEKLKQFEQYAEKEYKKKELDLFLIISPNVLGNITSRVALGSFFIPKENECELNDINISLQKKLMSMSGVKN